MSGCWTRKGDAGCLFQHAYWQGVADGVFADDGRVRAWVSGVAGRQAYHRVIDVIAAFDRLARAEYAVEQRRFGPPELDRERWRERVASLLVEVLGAGGDRPAPDAQPALFGLTAAAGLDLPRGVNGTNGVASCPTTFPVRPCPDT